MPMNPVLKQCRDQCAQAADEIRNLAIDNQDQRSKEMLTLGAGHLEMCIHQCDEALAMP